MPAENCTNHNKVESLEKVVTDLVKETALLVQSTSKMDVALTTLSDAVEIMARNATTVEFHTDQINEINAKIKEHDNEIKRINTSIYQACDTKTGEMATLDKELNNKIDTSEEKTEKHSTKLFIWSMVVIGVIASATFTTILVLKSDESERRVVTDGKLDTLIKLATSTDKKVSLHTLEINHIKEELDNHQEHKKGNK